MSDVSAIKDDPRVRWRNYKFIPYPETKRPPKSFCSQITFSYLSQVAKKGYYKPPLHFEDVYLAPYYHTEQLFEKAKNVLYGTTPNHEDAAAVDLQSKVIRKMTNFEFFKKSMRPIILKSILLEIEGEKDVTKLIMLSCFMFIASICVGIGHSQYLNAANNLLGLRWNGAMGALIFAKNLKSHAKTGNNGLNLIVGDCKILADTSLWSFRLPGFFSVIIYSVVMLFFEIGVGPALVGVCTLVSLLALQWYVGSKQAKYQKLKQSLSDQRLGLVRETINSIRGIKFSGWEEQTEARIHRVRAKEMNALFGFRGLWAINEFLAAIATVGASVLAIITYASISPTFNVSNVFTAIAFFNLLRQPLQFIPLMISAMSKGKTSLFRIKAYLDSCEKQRPGYKEAKSPMDVSISLNSITSGWNEIINDANQIVINQEENIASNSTKKNTSNDAVLKNITMHIKGPGLYGIIGKVGSGKSTLLSTILQDATLYEGTLNITGTVAYAPQQAWIMNATIRDNILFGQKYDKQRYNQVIDACGLRVDIELFPAKDDTEIGERGVNLSGGQKQRLALARCAYSSAQIMIFDDAFSALDVSVAKQVFEKLILGLLKDRTIILVTHYLHLLDGCSKIFVMKYGNIVESGTYRELADGGNEMLRNYIAVQDVNVEENVNLQDLSDNSMVKSNDASGSDNKNAVSNTTTKNVVKEAIGSETVEAGKKLVVDEHRQKGMVTFKTWNRYFLSFGGWKYFAPIILSSILIEASFAASDWWLTYDAGKSLHIYGILAICNAFTNVIRVTLFAFGTVRAATVFHNDILKSVISAPVLFFDINPSGRILQRFAGDFFDIEVMLPHFLEHAWLCLSHIVGIVLTMCILAPYTIIGLVPIFIFYFNMQKVYSANNRETKRLQSMSQSPMSSLISEATSGREVIRAFNMEKQYQLLFLKNFDGFSRCELMMKEMGYWQHIRVQFCGACIAFTACLVCSFTISNAGIAGLVINFAIIINFYLGGWVYLIAESEAFLTSVERVGEYCDMDQEAARYITPQEKSKEEEWPTRGELQFIDVCLRYRKNLPLALKQTSFTVKYSTSTGVVGRTGAGKSSLAVALFRLFEIESGKILIDGKDIKKLGLMDVRRKLSIVPQNPILFSATARKNLDPFNEYNDAEIWDVLQKTNLIKMIEQVSSSTNTAASTPSSKVNKEMLLETLIAENGSNLSVGTRQLICLARAMLRKPKLLVLDEATSALDLETDRAMQKILKEQFEGCTVIIIAHRLETVISCDNIIVMGSGAVIEEGSPVDLLTKNDGNGAFKMLVEATGKSYEELLSI